MNKKSFQYLDEQGIYFFDLSGEIDLKSGLSNIEQLEKFIIEHISDIAPLKLLVDFRKTVFESIQIHNELSKAARQKFNNISKKNTCFTAILNNEFTGSTFENERWFINKEEAVNWLLNQ